MKEQDYQDLLGKLPVVKAEEYTKTISKIMKILNEMTLFSARTKDALVILDLCKVVLESVAQNEAEKRKGEK
jgi:hypothetical protein